ncbi:MAG: hypothetical protein EA376_11520 [Phycisphaeraceae bacterium]|nr:MAG: hypothetical protein EA376_11520 [Phycisphaeraceae bacterium]
MLIFAIANAVAVDFAIWPGRLSYWYELLLLAPIVYIIVMILMLRYVFGCASRSVAVAAALCIMISMINIGVFFYLVSYLW